MDLTKGISWARTQALTRYYRSRHQGVGVWGTGVEVTGRLAVTGPGRVIVGDGCVLGGGSIHADPLVTVRLGEGCRIPNVEIWATNDVTIGAGLVVTDRLRIAYAGGVDIGDHARIRTLDVTAAGGVSVGHDLEVTWRAAFYGSGRIEIGNDCLVGMGGLQVVTEFPETYVRIGDHCFLNGLDAFATDDVTIGERCIIGECSLMTTDFHSTRTDRWSRDASAKRGAITIGSNVWLASRTVVNKGVTIGDNSVVSIGTVVREDVPANVIVSSHQQRIVKELPAQ